MPSSESTIHSFIVRVWIEESADEGHPAVWRGDITHALSRERKYITDLAQITAFISPYLAEMGVTPAPRRRWYRWISRSRSRTRSRTRRG